LRSSRSERTWDRATRFSYAASDDLFLQRIRRVLRGYGDCLSRWEIVAVQKFRQRFRLWVEMVREANYLEDALVVESVRSHSGGAAPGHARRIRMYSPGTLLPEAARGLLVSICLALWLWLWKHVHTMMRQPTDRVALYFRTFGCLSINPSCNPHLVISVAKAQHLAGLLRFHTQPRPIYCS
jgi:hypothetical protein